MIGRHGRDDRLRHWRCASPQQFILSPRPNGLLTTLQVYGSAHSAVFYVVLCDGSVRGISYTIAKDPFAYLGNKADGQQFDWNF